MVVADAAPAARDDASEARPLWSVMIPTYRPTEHLREAIESARTSLARCGAAAQFEIVDDASPDVDVEALIRSWRIDQIEVHRREANGGLGECWNTCIDRAKGRLIHILHQDDSVKPGFYERMGHLAQRHPDAGMYFCRPEFLDANGTRVGELEQPHDGLVDRWLERICSGQRVQCASVVVPRETYERAGRFEPSLRYVIDWEMWVRIATVAEVAYLVETLATYRIHDAAETGRVMSAGIATRDFASALTLIRHSLARVGRLDCLPPAERFALAMSIWTAQDAEARNQRRLAAREVRASLRYLSGAMDWRRWLRQARWLMRLSFNVWPLGVGGDRVARS